MVQVIEQSDWGELLGKSLGQGFSEGANQMIDFKMREILQDKRAKQQEKQQQERAQAAANKPFSVFDVMGALGKLGVTKDQMALLESNDYMEIAEKANAYIPDQGRDQAFLSAIQEKFNPQTAGSNLPSGLQALQNKETKEEDGLWDVLKKGLESSISGRLGAIYQGEGEQSFQERTALNKEGWFPSLLYNLAKFGGDFAYYRAGASLGAPVGAAVGASGGPFGATAGGLVGGGAGALAFRSMVETGLQEYQKYLDRGGKGTFGDFIDSAAKTIESGTYGAAEGALLGLLSRLKVLSKVPGGKKLLNLKGGKAAQKLIDTGAQAGLFTASVGAAEGRFPTAEEYGQNLGMFLGLDLFHNAGEYSKNVYNKLKKAEIPPQEAAVQIQETAQEKGYDLTKPNDIVRVVTDITGEKTKAGEVARETIKETEIPETASERAKKLAERPIDEYIQREKESERKKERPLTERERIKRETASLELPEVDRKLEKVRDDLNFLKGKLEGKVSKDQRPLVEIAQRQKQAELEALQKRREDLKGISEKGVKPFRESDLLESIDEHMESLTRAAEKPESPEAKDLTRMFERDQKYIDRFFDLAEKGNLPDAKFKDRYIKTLEAYQRGYTEALDRANKTLKEMQPYAESVLGPQKAKEKAVLERYKDLLQKNYEINKSKISNQKDKLNSLKQLKNPLVKQSLKEMRKDLKDLQKDFIKQIKIENALNKKVENILKDTILADKPRLKDYKLKNADAVADKIESKNLTDDVDKAAKKADVNSSKLRQFIDRLKPEISEIVKEFKQDPSKGIERARKLYRNMPFRYQLASATLISGLLAEMGVPYYVRFWFIPSNAIIRGLGTGIGGELRKKYHDMVIDSHVNKLMSARRTSMDEAFKYLKSIEDKLSPKERKEVMKRYQELQGKQ